MILSKRERLLSMDKTATDGFGTAELYLLFQRQQWTGEEFEGLLGRASELFRNVETDVMVRELFRKLPAEYPRSDTVYSSPMVNYRKRIEHVYRQNKKVRFRPEVKPARYSWANMGLLALATVAFYSASFVAELMLMAPS